MTETTRGGRQRLAAVLLVAFAMAAGPIAALGAAEPLTAAQREQAVHELAALLRARYCVAETAEKAAAVIEQRLQSGGYDAIVEADAFALAVTVDLQAATGDRHLRLGVPAPQPASPAGAGAAGTADAAAERAARQAAMRGGNFGLPRAQVLPGNVGLLEVRRFHPPGESGDTIVAAMGFLANADALIVDVRNCRGGSTHTMPLFAGYFFASPVSLFDMEFRGDGVTERYWTLPYLPGKRLAEAPMYILTSGYTFSGAEGFAYRFQVLKRATIVGEKTAGGANAGGALDVGPIFRAYLPMGRPIDRDTRGNWEGVGVTPDIAAPAREALAVAHRAALELLRERADSERERARLGLALEIAAALHRPVVPAAGELEVLAGTYGPFRVWVEGGQLRVQHETQAAYLLVPIAARAFASETDVPVRVEFLGGGAGAPERLVFADESGREEVAAR